VSQSAQLGDPAEPGSVRVPRGLDDPRAVDILTTEHWSLLSARGLGYQEIFGRATVFVAILSATVVALALLAQATDFGRASLWCGLLLMAVDLFIGGATFVRCVAINFEDARWVMGMDLLRRAYLQIVPELEPYFVAADRRSLGHGSPQRPANLARSLTTTSGVVATLSSVLAGSLAADIGALANRPALLNATFGVVASLVSAILHVWYAARYRRRHSSMPPLAR
jgi:hypothetical protein